MRRNATISLFTIFLFWLFCCSTISAQESQYPYGLNNYGDDTLKLRAIQVLENHIEILRDLKAEGNISRYKSIFVVNSPKHPCDFCTETRLLSVAEYTDKIVTFYPNGFQFDHQYDASQIELHRIQAGEWRVIVPFRKKITGVLNESNEFEPERTITAYMQVPVILNYNENSFGVESYSRRIPPGTKSLFAELNFLPGISTVAFDDQPGFIHESSSFLIKPGVVYYFNPFTDFNEQNIWLKTGLRFSYLSRSIKSGSTNYNQRVDLDVGDNQNNHQIDIKRSIRNIEETVRSFGLEVPIGISKRLTLNENVDLALELELSYTLELFENINGNYEIDQTGSDHLLNGDVQIASGGEDLIYDSTPQGVRTADGRDIYFFRNRVGLLDENETTNHSYLTISFNPSVFIKRYDQVKYRAGLVVSYLMIPTEEYTLTQNYFETDRNSAVPALNEISDDGNILMIGISAGIKL